MKTVNSKILNPDEKMLLAGILNNKGWKTHPVITDFNCHHVSLDYAMEVMDKIDTDELTDFGLELWAGLRKKLVYMRD